MHELILAWTEEGIVKSEKIQAQQPSKYPGVVRIGRDPNQCDIIITHPTVSGLHIEIFFHPRQQNFYLRNLRPSNPPVVDRKNVMTEEVPLIEGSRIYLGQIELKVISISGVVKKIPATIVNPHQPSVILEVNQPKKVMEIEIDQHRLSGMVAEIVNTDYFQGLQQLASKNRNKSHASKSENSETNTNHLELTEISPKTSPTIDVGNIYGSMCLNCHNIVPYQRDLWCIRCGHSMATVPKF